MVACERDGGRGLQSGQGKEGWVPPLSTEEG